MRSLKLNRAEHAEGSNRSRMVGSVVHKALSHILQNNIADPRVAQITVTEVELSRDLKHAKVFLTTSEPQQSLQVSVDQLNRAKSYIRHRLRDHLDLKYIPAIRFLADDVPTRSSRVIQLIDQALTPKD